MDLSSMAERLRVRTGRKPMYNVDDSDDDMEAMTNVKGDKPDQNRSERIIRPDAKDDTCQSCGDSGKLRSCDTCNYAYHLKCLLPPLKIMPRGSWSCPECVSPLENIEKILDCEMRPCEVDEGEAPKGSTKPKFVKQYLVKWKGLSYLHCSWLLEEEVQKAFKKIPRLRTKVNNFHQKMGSNTSEEDYVSIRPEWTTVDRIIATRKDSEKREYLVKWKELSYDECTWEVGSDISPFQSKIDRFYSLQSKADKKSKSKNSNRGTKEAKRKQKDFQQFDKTPDFLSGGSLHPYQLEGLNFLRFSWSKETHVILADEMGLGKTVQSIAFLASLFEEKIFPYLVVAPLSTLRNWEREFATWAPQMNVVMYVGSAQARSVIRQYEFLRPKMKPKKHKWKGKQVPPSKQSMQDRIKFDVLLTSYEMINFDTPSLKPIKWECMIVDEGHRLKNKDSKLFQILKQYTTKHRVLLTGTPLQNNLDELFMLMHFLDAGKFASLEEFQEEFKDINQEEQIARLHKMLAPHLLRRVKKDVMKDLPPKKELILRVELSALQKEYYKAILTRNYQILTRHGAAQVSLMNVAMELRKLCCHAYMLEGVEPEIPDADEAFRKLLESSGKLLLVDKLMVKLKEQGHRVLIYSQFRHMLDLLEDYLTYKKWNYERIDGIVSGVERQIRIDRFNAKDSTRFCFLLSTRAGGLGINLATADTVILYDSDWNPHADLQAMARAHRLGQTNKVMIYRLVTRGTIEERMMQMTKKKMVLEHLVVGRLKDSSFKQEELDDIIRYGSQELFAEDEDESGKARQIHYDDASIDRLLDREKINNEEASVEDEDDGFLKAFKVANFEYIDEEEATAAREEEAKKQTEIKQQAENMAERARYWEELLKGKYEEHRLEEFTALGKGKRSRKQMVSVEEDDLAGLEDVSSEEEDNDEGDWTDNGMGSGGGRKNHSSKKRSRVDTMEALPLMEGEGKSFRVLGFTQNQRAAFVQILMRFGLGEFDWSEFVSRMKQKTLEEIKVYGTLFLTHIAEDITNSPTFSDGVPKEGLRIPDVLVRIATLHLIRDKVKFSTENPGLPLFAEDIVSRFPGLRSSRYWKEEHDLSLLCAVMKHGYGRWLAIVEDPHLGFPGIICQEQNLPYVNGSLAGSSQMQDGAHCSFPETNFAHEQTGSSNGTINSQLREDGIRHGSGSVDEAVSDGGSQVFQDGLMSYESIQVQRRLVEFIKKRVNFLEKALSVEYQKDYFQNDAKGFESSSAEPEVEPMVHDTPKVQDIPSPNSLDADNQMQSLSSLDPIGNGELIINAYDNDPERLEMVRLYNEMCKLVNDNEQDSVQTYFGNKSAGFRLRKNLKVFEGIHEEVQRILGSKPPQASPATVVSESNPHKLVQSEQKQPVKVGVPGTSERLDCTSSEIKASSINGASNPGSSALPSETLLNLANNTSMASEVPLNLADTTSKASETPQNLVASKDIENIENSENLATNSGKGPETLENLATDTSKTTTTPGNLMPNLGKVPEAVENFATNRSETSEIPLNSAGRSYNEGTCEPPSNLELKASTLYKPTASTVPSGDSEVPSGTREAKDPDLTVAMEAAELI
ncbi:CHD3-type chromatin-remodeling factor PICKLE isoform X2 [Amborella trichopoda]|uniref:CHD3-type chromatin-remodeling factor PICKLE isoform X2 n=1 Tax=Amborella trichopoda TaxID=13333 RepID=UPI0005D3677F|nr:CHD3-type chromatin-remodeling factor PICKLE isoform X2 [Amborella trichopoda]|eukprot:XP_011622141.1 CHD3-type chromatin-remodeling factor PICKLE isoform X2 [Amborella trichopoda]